MQINKNRKGLALGAALSLFASLFVGAAPASANTDGQYIAVTPDSGPVTNFNGTVYEDFPVVAYLLPGVTNAQFTTGSVIVEVTKVSGNMDVLLNNTQTASGAIGDDARAASFSTSVISSLSGVITADKTSTYSTTVSGRVNNATGEFYLNLRAASSSALTSASPTTTVTLKFWIENLATANGEHDTLEWFTTKTVVLHNANAIPATVTIGSPISGNTVITASGTVSALNFDNLGGTFALQLASSAESFTAATTGVSETISPSITSAVAADRAGVVSFSFPISQSAGIAGGTSFSGLIVYDPTNAATAGTDDQPSAGSYRLGALATVVVGQTKTATLTLDVTPGVNATQSGQTATVRANNTYTFTVGASSGSASISAAALSLAISSSVALTANVKEISINGAAATTSWPTATALTTGTGGEATFTVMTSGFEDGNDFTLIVTEQNVSVSLEVQVEGTNPVLTADYSQLASAPGATTAVTYSVKDQWGVLSTATNLRLKMEKRGTGFSYTDTISYVAVVGGKATFNFTPTPATKTGSAVVRALLQELQASTGTYLTENGSTDVDVTVNVSSTADGFGTGLRASYSTSVSYFPSTLAAAVAVGGKATNTGSAIAVSGPGLVFGDASGATASDAITVRADGSLAYSVNVWGTKAGTYTITFTNGTATTTSQFIVDAAAHDSGRSIVFDTTAIEAGKTRIVTGTVLDANGNPVDTTAGAGTASILVVFAGTAGIPVGSMPTETNADGQFQVSVLTSAADRGTLTLTASYYKNGAATAVADVVTAVQPITVGAASSAPASDQKLTVGSFKGFVAIYALNYTGQKLSAKVAGKWLVVNELSRFQRVVRNTGAGFTIKVDLYIDGAFVRSETVVTK